MATRASSSERTSSQAAKTEHQPPREKNLSKAPEGELLSIGELAKRARVSPRTIRYYEEIGILPVPTRTVGGSRRYPREYTFYVEGALLLKDMGFTLEEVKVLGQWALDRTNTASEHTQNLLESKVTVLEHRIRVLNRLHDLVKEAARGDHSTQTEQTPELLRLLGEETQWSTIEDQRV